MGETRSATSPAAAAEVERRAQVARVAAEVGRREQEVMVFLGRTFQGIEREEETLARQEEGSPTGQEAEAQGTLSER